MIEQWKLFKRWLLAGACRIDCFTMTWKMRDGAVWYISDNPDLTLEDWFKMEGSIWDQATREPAVMRVDAVTTPCYSTAALSKLLTCFVPCSGRVNDSSSFDTPKRGIDGLSVAWHEAVMAALLLEPQTPIYDPVKELRYNWGQPDYAHDYNCHGSNENALESYTFSPRQRASHNMAAGDAGRSDVSIWMNRGLMEMLPVKIYRRLVFIDNRATGFDDRLEETAVACLADGGTAAHRLYNEEVSLLPSANMMDSRLGLCASMGRTRKCLAIKSDYSRNNNFSLPSSYHGPGCLADMLVKPVVLKWRQYAAMDINDMQSVRRSDVPVKQELINLHEGDAMWLLLQTAIRDDWK